MEQLQPTLKCKKLHRDIALNGLFEQIQIIHLEYMLTVNQGNMEDIKKQLEKLKVMAFEEEMREENSSTSQQLLKG